MHCCEEASEIKVLYVFCKILYVIKVLFRFRRKIKNKIILILLLLLPSFSKNYKPQASNSSSKSNGNAKFSTFIYLFVMITSVYFFFDLCDWVFDLPENLLIYGQIIFDWHSSDCHNHSWVTMSCYHMCCAVHHKFLILVNVKFLAKIICMVRLRV